MPRCIFGVLPAHALTTIHYIVAKYSGTEKANEAVDWLLTAFDIATLGRREFFEVRTLALSDFEDAVVAETAFATQSDVIVTRNVRDFSGSPVPALTPEELLAEDGDQSAVHDIGK